MRCTVVWTTQARDKSARLWVSVWMHDAAKARRFSAAANWIVQQLENSPQTGQSRGSAFVLRRDPIEVVYTFSPLDDSVTITDIDLCGP